MSGTPMLKAAGLWEKTSAKGNRYFVGRLGGVKILILENQDAAGESDPTHSLFFVEAAPKTAPAPQGQPRRAPSRQRHDRPAADPRPFDDEVPF